MWIQAIPAGAMCGSTGRSQAGASTCSLSMTLPAMPVIDVSQCPPTMPTGVLRVTDTFTKDLSANPSTSCKWVADMILESSKLVGRHFKPRSAAELIGAGEKC